MSNLEFGIYVRSELRRRGLQQKNLAQAIGCTDAYLSQVLNGEREGFELKSKIKKYLLSELDDPQEEKVVKSDAD
ncbi:helix-turn-helix domain-containing protein [Listeria ilorinensis]|uniref:helix-turn-helix domain-containing protein n=1 Tax=Listeria ilorinensis TaxID=2867439 RepID=UPI001EF711CE|nr:helix-turn-helix transcriptional regulator [Listeria ilorinensis]